MNERKIDKKIQKYWVFYNGYDIIWKINGSNMYYSKTGESASGCYVSNIFAVKQIDKDF